MFVAIYCPKYIALNRNGQVEITRQSGLSRTILADRMGNQGTDPLEKDDGGGRFLRTSPQLFITWGEG